MKPRMFTGFLCIILIGMGRILTSIPYLVHSICFSLSFRFVAAVLLFTNCCIERFFFYFENIFYYRETEELDFFLVNWRFWVFENRYIRGILFLKTDKRKYFFKFNIFTIYRIGVIFFWKLANCWRYFRTYTLEDIFKPINEDIF